MKFIQISDVHLGIKPDRGRIWSDERAEEIKESFWDIINICEEQKIDLLLIAGNLYHKAPTEQELKKLDNELRRLTVTRTLIIAGSKDYLEEDSIMGSFEFSSNTVVFPRDKAVSAYFEDLNVAITGYSYGQPEYTENILEKLSPGKEGAYNILLGHGGDENHMPFEKNKLARLGFQYVALGGREKPSHMLKNKMAYSGSLEPLSHKNTGKRGYLLGEVEADGTTKITLVAHNKRSYVNLTVELSTSFTNREVMDLVEKQMKESGEQNIFRILLKGMINSELEINLSSLTKKYYINEIIDKTESDYNMEELLLDNENNMLGCFVKALSKEDSMENEETRNRAMKYGIEAIFGR